MSNYIPYLSSSPPPLETKDSLEDDEFGSFSHAGYGNEECENNSSSGTKASPVNSYKKLVSDGDVQKPSWIKEHSLSFEWDSSSRFDANSECSNSITSDGSEDSRPASKTVSLELSSESSPQPKRISEKRKLERCESLENKLGSSDDGSNEITSDKVNDENIFSSTSLPQMNDAYSPVCKSDACDNASSDNDDWADFASAPTDVVSVNNFNEMSCNETLNSEFVPSVGNNFIENHSQRIVTDSSKHSKSFKFELFGSSCTDESNSVLSSINNPSTQTNEYCRTGMPRTLKDDDQYNSLDESLEKQAGHLQLTDFEQDESVEKFSSNAQYDLKSLSSISDECADSHNKLGNLEKNSLSDDHKEAVDEVVVSEQCDDDDEDEFDDFVSPSDDCLATVRNRLLKDTDSALGTDNSEMSFDDHCEQQNIQEDTETFQPNFEANFDEEFGTFNFASSYPLTQGCTNLHKIDDIVHRTFDVNLPPVNEESSITLLDDALKLETGSSKCNCNVWYHLSDFEKTNALTYHWNNSQANKTLLKSLNIDSRNLLFGRNWNSSIPIFAANLSFNPLEPIKMSWKAKETSVDPGSPSKTTKALDGDDGKNIIPPAQFDWNSSGLVNPLDGLENELLGPNSDNQPDKQVHPSSTISPLLEQILASAKLSMSKFPKPRENTVLSAEAQQIINQLPDLNFMQAKVLMFPIRNLSP